MDSINGFEEAFDEFIKMDAESAIIKSTRASWGGSGYSVELFPDGHYRVLWNNQIGNLYDSPGAIIGIPALGDDEYDTEDESSSFFDNAIESLQVKFEQMIEDIKGL